jgi:hypothetical protein
MGTDRFLVQNSSPMAGDEEQLFTGWQKPAD